MLTEGQANWRGRQPEVVLRRRDGGWRSLPPFGPRLDHTCAHRVGEYDPAPGTVSYCSNFGSCELQQNVANFLCRRGRFRLEKRQTQLSLDKKRFLGRVDPGDICLGREMTFYPSTLFFSPLFLLLPCPSLAVQYQSQFYAPI